MEKTAKTATKAEKSKTTKTRSPGYPAIGLKEAVEKITAIYHQDYQNPISREVAVEHMGYNGLNGKSLTVLSTLGKYGLLEGRGDNSRVSDLAMTIIAHPRGTAEHAAAIKEAAAKPDLFAELDGRFQNGKVSDQAIRSYLLTQKFIPAAADAAIRAYRETKELVQDEASGYNEPEKQGEDTSEMEVASAQTQGKTPFTGANEIAAQAGARRAVFVLDEGDVTISFPESLSTDSVADLEAYLAIFMKKAKRDAAEKAH